jgi:biotin carboxylase
MSVTGRRSILVIGAGKYQVPIIEMANRRGCHVVAVDGDPGAPGLALADVAIVHDVRDATGCVQLARDHKISAVTSICAEVAVETVAAIAESLDLPGISTLAARQSTDKGLMRLRLEECGVPGPPFKVVSDVATAEMAAIAIGYPVIVKPVDNAGSRGVKQVLDVRGLVPAFNNAISNSRKGQAIVESFMTGVESTVEAMTFCGETVIHGISDKEHDLYPYCVANSINYPGLFEESVLFEIRQVVCNAIAALGIEMGPIHAELMVTPDGVKVIEIAARGGGFRIFSKIVRLISGIDAVQQALQMALGEPPSIQPRESRSAVLKFLRPPRAGVLREIRGVSRALTVPGVVEVELDVAVGDRFTDITADGERPGYILSSAQTRVEAMAAAAEAEKLISFMTED